MRHDTLHAFSLSRRLTMALALSGTALAVGTVGYMLMSGLSFVGALYQTVITLTTVGFSEPKPFGTWEKLFTIALIIGGVGIALYTFSLIMQEALEGDLRGRFYRRRMEMEIARMRKHYVLCGFGRVGQEIARELRQRGVDFVVIEANAEAAAHAQAFGYHVINGDASEERMLVQAGLPEARCLLAASDTDAGNTYITLTARNLAPSCFIVARVASPHNEEKLRLAGADRVLSLYALGGRRMVLQALQPLAADFMDTLASGRHGELILAEFEVNEQNGLAGETCGSLVAGAPSATLLGIRHRSGSMIVGPRGAEELHDGDIVIVMAEDGDIARMVQGRGR